MKAYVYETFEQLGRIPANIVIPVGNGTLFIGAVKALEHLHASGAIERFPNIIALKSEKCDPLYRAREAGLEDPARVTPAPTMAEGIAIGVPMRGREILDMMKRHDIRVVHAPEDRILEARALLARRGIYCEHTTAANYAAYTKPIYLAGDLNTSKLPAAALESWKIISTSANTFVNTSSPSRIDYVLVYTGNSPSYEVLRTAVPSYEEINVMTVSDHLPVLVDLKK